MSWLPPWSKKKFASTNEPREERERRISTKQPVASLPSSRRLSWPQIFSLSLQISVARIGVSLSPHACRPLYQKNVFPAPKQKRRGERAISERRAQFPPHLPPSSSLPFLLPPFLVLEALSPGRSFFFLFREYTLLPSAEPVCSLRSCEEKEWCSFAVC